MANSLRLDLKGQWVVMREGTGAHPTRKHTAYLSSRLYIIYEQGAGFGAHPTHPGQLLYGRNAYDGRRAVLNGIDVERLASDQERAAAPILSPCGACGGNGWVQAPKDRGVKWPEECNVCGGKGCHVLPPRKGVVR